MTDPPESAPPPSAVVDKRFVEAVVSAVKTAVTLRGAVLIGGLALGQVVMVTRMDNRLANVEGKTKNRFTAHQAEAMEARILAKVATFGPAIANVRLELTNKVLETRNHLLEKQVQMLRGQK